MNVKLRSIVSCTSASCDWCIGLCGIFERHQCSGMRQIGDSGTYGLIACLSYDFFLDVSLSFMLFPFTLPFSLKGSAGTVSVKCCRSLRSTAAPKRCRAPNCASGVRLQRSRWQRCEPPASPGLYFLRNLLMQLCIEHSSPIFASLCWLTVKMNAIFFEANLSIIRP